MRRGTIRAAILGIASAAAALTAAAATVSSPYRPTSSPVSAARSIALTRRSIPPGPVGGWAGCAVAAITGHSDTHAQATIWRKPIRVFY